MKRETANIDIRVEPQLVQKIAYLDPDRYYASQEQPCAVCGLWSEDCICPECLVCHEYGNPGCYIDAFEHNHGLVRSQQQIDSLAEKKAAWKAEDLRARYEFLLDWMGVVALPEMTETELDCRCEIALAAGNLDGCGARDPVREGVEILPGDSKPKGK